MATFYIVTFVLLLVRCCYGDESGSDHISHLILLDDIPGSLVENVSPHIEIRTNYSGELEFRESDQFKVLLNISAPTIQEAYAVAADLSDHNGSLLVQIYNKPGSSSTYSLRWIFITVGCITMAVLLLVIAYVIWWYSKGHYQKLYGEQAFLSARNMSRSRNSVHMAQGGDPLIDPDGDDDLDGVDDYYTVNQYGRRKEKTYVSTKPETIMEESEESADDDRTNPKHRYTNKIPVRYNKRHISVSEQQAHRVNLTDNNLMGSGLLDYHLDHSGDELENDLSPDQIIAGANGNYTPLDEIDDMLHHEAGNNFGSVAKLCDPRGNLDYNIHASKSDGDLLGDNKKVSEKEKVIPTPLVLPKPKKKPVKPISIPKRAEPNIYQRGLNLRPPPGQENDLNMAPPPMPDKVRAQVHTPEHQYVNNSFGNYMELRTPESLSRSRISRESNEAYEYNTYSADIPMTTFKAANSSPMKESHYQVPKRIPPEVLKSSSPTNFDFKKLDLKVKVPDSREPISPGKFSMLSAGSDSTDNSDDEFEHKIAMLEDSDIEDLPSPLKLDADVGSLSSQPLPSPPPPLPETGSYDANGQISQLSPRLSLVTPLDSKDYGTMIALTGSPSPGGPYSKHAVNRFVFPPPPSMFSEDQTGSRRELDFNSESSGDFAGLPLNLQSTPKPGGVAGASSGKPIRQQSFGKRDRRVSEGERERARDAQIAAVIQAGRERHHSGPAERERKQSFGKKGGKLPKHLHLTILTTFCVLSLLSGVYCATSSGETTVNIVVYVPKSYPYKNSTVVSAINKDFKIRDSQQIKWLVSKQPVLVNVNSTKCLDKKCAHACDPNTGRCICHHGYTMKHGQCVDINECLTGMMQCPNPKSGCLNNEGSYECLCSEKSNLYRYDDMCLDCSDPCPAGRYEIQDCHMYRSLPKICKECTKSCGENYFLKEPCTELKDAVCMMCSPQCDGTREFEYQQCSTTQNRQCKEKFRLPKPYISDNVILDDLDAELSHHAQDLTGSQDRNAMVQNFTYNAVHITQLLLKKGVDSFGAEFWVELTLKDTEHVMTYEPVDHSDVFEQRDYSGPAAFLNYCPYPLPNNYELKYVKHHDKFYKGDIESKLEACESHPDSFPNMQTARENSIFCTKPGLLSDVFVSVNPGDYKTSNTVWEEISDSCRVMHETCENCTRNCSEALQTTADPECTITADDDSGTSPRLPTCFKCCMDRICKDVCENYHDSRCMMVQCHKGNLVQFQLQPLYDTTHGTGDSVFCHIQPKLRARVMTVQYNIHIDRMHTQPILTRKLDIVTDENWAKTGRIRASDDIIYLELDSMVNEQPDIVKLTTRTGQVKAESVGKYHVFNKPLKEAVISSDFALVRPTRPFMLNKKQFVQESCEDFGLDNLVLTAFKEVEPYIQMRDLNVQYTDDSSLLVFNKTFSKGQVGINSRASLLRALLKPTNVRFDTLSATMSHNGTHWLVVLRGEVESCPGVFSLNVSDKGYVDAPLYMFDVGIECPKVFAINFTIPTGDSATLSKDMQLQVRDELGTFILVVHTVGRNDTIGGNYPDTGTPSPVSTTATPHVDEPAHFSTLFIAVVVGVVVLLLLLLTFGVAWKQGIPEGDIQRFRIRLLVILVIYITVQFLYSLLASMTVFVLVVRAVNVDTTTFLRQYNQQRSVTNALSQLELDSMETHLWAELRRQQEVGMATKHDCYETIQMVIKDVEKLRDSIESQAVSTIEKQNLKNLITDHSQTTLDKFAKDLLDFRSKYTTYEKYILHKLTSELNNTYRSIHTAKMLQGARYVYNLVRIKRELYGRSGMSDLMTWLNMQTNMMSLAGNLTLPLPDLPVLKVDNSDVPASSTSSHHAQLSPLSVQTVNKWFVQSDVVVPSPAQSSSQQGQDVAGKVTTLDMGSYGVFVVCMVIIDALLLIHRMVKACGVGKLLLYGYPVYVDARERKGEKKSNKKPLTRTCRNIATKCMSTMFIPKMIGTIFVCLMVGFVYMCADRFINRQTFALLGYHNDMEDVMRIQQDVINSRLSSNADRVNALEYKMYEDAMNVNIQNHQYVLSLIETQWRAIEKSHSNMYCNYLGRINVTASCHGDSGESTLSEVRPDRCSFAPIIPELYKRNMTESARIAGAQLDGFLTNIRKLIFDTCFVIALYLASIIIKELFGTVLWIYVKRSGFVSLRIIYETDEAPGSSDSSTINKP